MSAQRMRLKQIKDVRVLRGIPSSRTTTEGEIPVKSMAALRGDEPVTRFMNSDSIGFQENVVQAGDLLVGLNGAEIGHCFVAVEADGIFAPAQQIAIVRIGQTSEVDPWFLSAWFTSAQGRQQLDGLVRSTVVPRISIDDFSRQQVPVPPMVNQVIVAERHRAFMESIDAHRALLISTEQLLKVELALAFAEMVG